MEKTENKWVEIISVRLSSPEHRSKVRKIIAHVRSGRCPLTGNKVSAELYVNQVLEMDWSIHLIRKETDGPPGKTFLGVNIAEMLASLGLINHSVWELCLTEKETKERSKE